MQTFVPYGTLDKFCQIFYLTQLTSQFLSVEPSCQSPNVTLNSHADMSLQYIKMISHDEKY